MENLDTEQSEALSYLVFDENDDGELDTILEYATNEFGKLSEVVLDYDKDGFADIKIYFEYDKLGRLIRKLKYSTTNEKKPKSITTYEYDRNGKATIIYDDNADGKNDYIETPEGEIKDLREKKEIFFERIKNIFPPKIRKKLK